MDSTISDDSLSVANSDTEICSPSQSNLPFPIAPGDLLVDFNLIQHIKEPS